MNERQLYLDCDGVLADFERGARTLLGMSAEDFQQRHGVAAFWQRLAKAPGFYARLPLMPGAMELFDAVRHLQPIILTGLPRGNWAAPQKVRWARQHFPDTTIIATPAVDKRNHCRAGDVLVDDLLKHRHLWEGAGGVFIHHRSVPDTLRQLSTYFDLAGRGVASR